MKILILQDDFPPKSLGGAGSVAFNLAKSLKSAGNDVYVITTVQDIREEGEIEYGNLKIFKVYSKYHQRWRAYLSLYNPMVVGKVKKIMDSIKPDVVHAHNVHYHISYHSLKIARKNGAKVFLTAHDVMLFHYGKLVEFIDKDDMSSVREYNYKITAWQQIKKYKKRYNPLRNTIIRYYLRYVDRVFAVSNTLKNALNQNGIKNVEVVHNVIDVNDWTVSHEQITDFKNKYKIQDKNIILFGGRLSEAKGGHQAILALKNIIM